MAQLTEPRASDPQGGAAVPSEVASERGRPRWQCRACITFLAIMLLVSFAFNVAHVVERQSLYNEYASRARYAKARAERELVLRSRGGMAIVDDDTHEPLRQTTLSLHGQGGGLEVRHGFSRFNSVRRGFSVTLDASHLKMLPPPGDVQATDNKGFLMCRDIVRQILAQDPDWYMPDVFPHTDVNGGVGTLYHPLGAVVVVVLPTETAPDRLYRLWIFSRFDAPAPRSDIGIVTVSSTYFPDLQKHRERLRKQR